MDKKYRKLMGLNDKSKANDGLRRIFSLDASANATYTGLKEEFKELKKNKRMRGKLRKRLWKFLLFVNVIIISYRCL